MSKIHFGSLLIGVLLTFAVQMLLAKRKAKA